MYVYIYTYMYTCLCICNRSRRKTWKPEVTGNLLKPCGGYGTRQKGTYRIGFLHPCIEDFKHDVEVPGVVVEGTFLD